MTVIDRKSKTSMSRAERIARLRKRDGPNCFAPFCGKPFDSDDDITFDHWIPQSAGGTWEIENLRMMHKRCNAIKSDRIPNADGTLPPLPRDLQPRAADKSMRVEVCTLCESGRLLWAGEECPVCGSGPQPVSWPKYLQRTPKECDHREFHCWMCVIGHIERTPAYKDAFNLG